MKLSLTLKRRFPVGFCSALALMALLSCRSMSAQQQPTAPPQASDNSWRQLAEEGHAFAQVNLGMSYAAGQAGVAQDYAEAVRWFRKAAAQKNPLGELYLGNMYSGGLGVAKSPLEALRWYRMAAAQGNASAEFYLGNMFGNGEGVVKDESEAARWHLKAAEQRHEPAMIALGISYGLGRGIPQDYAQALRWFRLCAERGNAMAEYRLANMYAQGQGVSQDFVAAYTWMKIGALRAGNRFQLKPFSEALAQFADKLGPQQIVEAQRAASEWKPNTNVEK